MIAAVPADHQIKRIILDADDNLVNQSPHDALARRPRHALAAPSPVEISAKRHKPRAISRSQIGGGIRRQSLQLGLQIADDRQALVPAVLQFGGDKAIVGVDGIVLTTRAADLVARLLERQFELPSFVVAGAATRLFSAKRRLDPERSKAINHLGRYGPIDSHAAERDALITAMIEVAAPAMIATGIAVLT